MFSGKKMLIMFLALGMISCTIPTVVLAENGNNIATFQGHTYERIDMGMTWKEAKLYCEGMGGHLATITSAEEQAVVQKLVAEGTQAQYWLGGTDEEKEGEWKWITGEKWSFWHSTVTFNNYNNNEHYLQIQRHHWGDKNYLGVWNDINNENYIAGQDSFFATANTGLICEWDTPINKETQNMQTNLNFENADLREFNGHTYLLVTDAVKPTEAELLCQNMGGHLVTITSQAENNFLKGLFAEKSQEGYILGGTDRVTEGQWQWMTGEAWTFSDWNSPPEPNDGIGRGEDYVFAARDHGWKWVDFFGGWDNYSSKFAYVCEWDAKLVKKDKPIQVITNIWSGTWSAKTASGTTSGSDASNIYYIEQIGDIVNITYYLNEENAKSGKIYGSIKGRIQPDGSITGLNWFYDKTGTPDRVVTITKKGNQLEIVRKHSSGTYADTLCAGKISDYYPKDKIFAGNQNADLDNQKSDISQYGNEMPTPDNAVPVTVKEGNGKNTTQVFNGVTGVTIICKIANGALGYRVFRSENEAGLGISVTDFYITANNFTDVNVEPGTTYYYTIKPVLSEADPFNDKREQLGEVIAKWTVTTADSVGKSFANASKTRHFIMLKIDDPKMSVDGALREVDPGRGTAPIILNGRTVVPIRAIVEAMDGKVGWNGATSEVSLGVNGIDVRMWVDKKELTKNSQKYKMDVPPTVMNNRTFVPLRFGAENLNCQVDWINSTKSIVIVWSE